MSSALTSEHRATAARVADALAAEVKDIPDVQAEYEIRLSRAVVDVMNGDETMQALERTHWALIRAYAMQMFIEGLRDGGIEGAGPDDLDADDEAAIKTWEDGQREYISGLAAAAAAAAALPEGSKEQIAAQRAVNERVKLWGQSLRDLGNMGKASAMKNKMVTWRLGATEEHCTTCATLNGKRRRLKWFTERDYYPQKNGAAMECGGWRCECTLRDDKGRQVLP